MTVRDSITRTGARTPGAEDYPTSMAAHVRAPLPTQRGIIIEVASTCAKDRHKPHISRCMPGAGLSRPSVGRCCPTCQPSSRIGENPPYGMIGRVEETSASFEARSAPRLYPTAGGARQLASLPRRRNLLHLLRSRKWHIAAQSWCCLMSAAGESGQWAVEGECRL